MRNTALDMLIGAAAGAAATWLMDQTTTALMQRENDAAKQREKEARGGSSAYQTAAKKIASSTDREITDDQAQQYGKAIHWATGIAAGAMYGLLRNRLDGLGIGSGVAYGVAVWLVMDETVPLLFGLTAPPREFPWQTHARGLAGHLVLGAAVEAPFDLIAA